MNSTQSDAEQDRANSDGSRALSVWRITGRTAAQSDEQLAVEEPLEIRIVHGPAGARQQKAISVTMRTPGQDAELAVGFLLTEGVIADAADVADARHTGLPSADEDFTGNNVVVVTLDESVSVNLATLQRNFYTTSSCGICGKASLLALRTVCPPRRANAFLLNSSVLCGMPAKLRAQQGIFNKTGGLHAAGLFRKDGELQALREDVGRHNAVDKLVGMAALNDMVPLRESVLFLSGRASFELLQKAVMAGIPMVAAIGAPSSLAVRVAKEFDVTLVGFVRDDHFNIYNGVERIIIQDAAAEGV